MRFSLLLFFLAIPLLGTAQPNHTTKVTWLTEHAAPIRSLDLEDTDYSDLAPLKSAIGNARIVMLGEQSHADGATFEAKARLVRFLHEEMDFDVLAFESGLYACHEAWQRIQAGEDAVETASQAIFGVWMRSAQVQPLFRYLGERAQTARPLALAGFDLQLTGPLSQQFLPAFQTYLDAETPIDTTTWQAFSAPFKGMFSGQGREVMAYDSTRQAAFHTAVSDLQAELNTHDAPETALWLQLTKSLDTFLRFMWAVDFQNPDPDVMNLRDAQMADNFLWLAKEAYPDSKIIVWGATSHVTRNRQDIETDSAPKMIPMGHLVHEALGDAVYSIGFTAYKGEIGFASPGDRGTPQPIESAPETSLEGLLHDTGHPIAFLDFRALHNTDHWLTTPHDSRPMGYGFMRADWTSVMDGLIYIETMTPSHMVE